MKRGSDYMTVTANVGYVDVDVDRDEIIGQLERAGYTVSKGMEPDDVPTVAAMYEAYTRGDLRHLDRLLRALFDSGLGRVPGRSPFDRMAA